MRKENIFFFFFSICKWILCFCFYLFFFFVHNPLVRSNRLAYMVAGTLIKWNIILKKALHTCVSILYALKAFPFLFFYVYCLKWREYNVQIFIVLFAGQSRKVSIKKKRKEKNVDRNVLCKKKVQRWLDWWCSSGSFIWDPMMNSKSSENKHTWNSYKFLLCLLMQWKHLVAKFSIFVKKPKKR